MTWDYPWIDGIDIRDILGPLGVLGYIGAYLALQLGFLKGQGYLFPTVNLLASMAILISLTRDFNPYSATIETAWSAISAIGIARIYISRRFGVLTKEQSEVVKHFVPTIDKGLAQRLLRLGRPIEAQIGQIISDQGETVRDFAILIEGLCHIEMDGFHIASVSTGTLIDELTFASHISATTTVRVASPSRLFLIERSVLLRFLLRNPEAIADIERSIAGGVRKRLNETTERLSFHLENSRFRHVASGGFV